MQRRTRKLLIIFVLVPVTLGSLLLGAVALRRYQVAASIQRGYEEGKAAFAAQKYDQALPGLARYVGRNREDADALLMLAESRARVPKPEGTELVEAAGYAKQALAVQPRNEKALNMLIELYGQVGFFTELNGVCDTLLSIQPDNRAALMAKAHSLLVLGKYGEVRPIIDRLASADPTDPDPLRLLLEVRQREGASPADIARECGELTGRFPQSFELGVIHGQTLVGAGDLDRAVAAINRTKALKPARLRGLADYLRLIDTTCGLLRIRADGGGAEQINAMVAAGRAAIESALREPKLAGGASIIAAGWDWRAGRVDEAKRWTDPRGQSELPGALAWRAIIARDQGQPIEPALTALRGATGPHAAVWTKLIEALKALDAGQLSEADAAFGVVEAATRKLTSGLAVRADAETDADRTELAEVVSVAGLFAAESRNRQGDWRSAVQRWTAAAEIERGWTRPLVLSARVLLEQGQADAAFELAAQAFALRGTTLEGLTLVQAAIARAEVTGVGADSPRLNSVLAELAKPDNLRAQVLPLQTRLAILRSDAAALSSAVKALTAGQPPIPAGVLIDLAQRIRSAGMSGDAALVQAAQQSGGAIEVAALQAVEAVRRGQRDEALNILRKARAAATGQDAIALQFQEASILAEGGLGKEARELLGTISREQAASAAVQSTVLAQPILWADAGLVETVIQRLRLAAGEQSTGWQIADAGRLLTFSPEPAKAQDVVVRLTRIVRDDPKNSQALSLLGEWMLVLKDDPAAVDYFSRALDAPDAAPNLHPRLIDLLKRLGRADDARARLERFASLQRLSPELRRTRARLFVEAGLPERARPDLEALARQGGPADQLLLAETMLAQRKPADAVATLRPLLDQADLPRDLFMRAAGGMVDAGQVDAALAAVDRRSGAGTPASLGDRAQLLERAGRLEDARGSYEAAAAAGSDAQAVLELARFHLRRAQPERVKEIVAAARGRGMKSSELDGVEALATVAVTGSASDAQARTVIDSIPAGPARDLAEATRWFDQNPSKTDEFITRLRGIVKADPGLVLGWRFLVNALMQAGQMDEAVVAARSASQASPGSPEALALESTTLLSAGKLAEARSAVQRWRTAAIEPLEPAVVGANIELLEDRPAAAIEIIKPAIQSAKNAGRTIRPELWARVISVYARAGRVDLAREIADAHTPADAAWLRAMVQIAGGEAVPFDRARAWLGSLRTTLERDPAAVPGLAEAYADLAGRSGEAEDARAALALLETRLQSAEASAGELTLAGTMLEQLERGPEAEPLYRRAIEKDPAQWIALNNLAYLLSRDGRATSESLDLARRAVKAMESVNPPARTRGTVLHTLAMNQLLSGRADEALGTVRRALTLNGESAELRITEAEALEATGAKDRARGALAAVMRQAESGGAKLSPRDEARAKRLAERLGR